MKGYKTNIKAVVPMGRPDVQNHYFYLCHIRVWRLIKVP